MLETFLDIEIDSLQPDLNQVRKVFLPDEIARLAASITARGVLMPLRVMRDEERDCYRIITGESRWRAARLAGLKTLPCILVAGTPDEVDLLADQVIENHCRAELRPLDFARALAKLKSLKRCTSQALAAELGISGAAITRAEALLSLPEAIQNMVEDGRILPAAAYEISRLPTPDSQIQLAHAVAAGLSRDETAERVQGVVGKKKTTPKASRLACKLDGGVSVTFTAEKPWSWDDFNTAMDRIKRAAKKLIDDGKDVSFLAQMLRSS
jgi:ParB family chromosome partitioning protein